jgi:hypothetical protein
MVQASRLHLPYRRDASTTKTSAWLFVQPTNSGGPLPVADGDGAVCNDVSAKIRKSSGFFLEAARHSMLHLRS